MVCLHSLRVNCINKDCAVRNSHVTVTQYYNRFQPPLPLGYVRVRVDTPLAPSAIFIACYVARAGKAWELRLAYSIVALYIAHPAVRYAVSRYAVPELASSIHVHVHDIHVWVFASWEFGGNSRAPEAVPSAGEF